MQKIILATGNQHKVEEITSILQDNIPNFDSRILTTSKELNLGEPVEDGVTFAENALIKARYVFKKTGCFAIADDSGIIVDALGNAPGVLSARWSGRHGDDLANTELLLNQIADFLPQQRKARFVSAVALVGEGVEIVELGQVKGSIATIAMGENGFGYDPIFIPEGMDKTMAMLTADEKNAISHRKIAFTKLSKSIEEIL